MPATNDCWLVGLVVQYLSIYPALLLVTYGVLDVALTTYLS